MEKIAARSKCRISMQFQALHLVQSTTLILVLIGCITYPQTHAAGSSAPESQVVQSEVLDGSYSQPDRKGYVVTEKPRLVQNTPQSVENQTSAPQDAAVKRSPVMAQSAEVAAQDDDDIWARLRADFEMPSSRHKPEVKRWIRWYQKNPRHLELMFERSRYYLKYVVDQVDNRHMPMEVALLPAVESAFDPFAYSHGQAAGMWQFIPMTADRFKLRRDWWYDGRRDVLQSTAAALDYLSYLSRLFDGDWALAMAAYNSGEGRVGRAVRKNKMARRGVAFWDLDLPVETTNYVPKLVALAEIIRHPERYGVTLPSLPNRDVFMPVALPGQIDLAQAADMAKVDLSLIQKLNPGHNRWATAPTGPHRILLPIEATDRFKIALAAKGGKGLVTWQRHKITSGDNLSHLASRFETSVEMIRKANDIDGSSIRIGQHLMIPVSTRGLKDYSLSANSRLEASLESARRSSSSAVYEVSSGDSYWSIAKKYGVSVDELLRWNKLSRKSYVRPRQKLVIRSATRSLPKHLKKVNYTVRSGDSLDYISRKFQVSILQICDWNKIESTAYLQPGQRLRVFVNPMELSS
ncbi:MAG: membrane-bound lytic murein transglycosylase D [Pseudoalteromonas tetraodonis]|jgi:membrane-bound lytic murein transglycosylase D